MMQLEVKEINTENVTTIREYFNHKGIMFMLNVPYS